MVHGAPIFDLRRFFRSNTARRRLRLSQQEMSQNCGKLTLSTQIDDPEPEQPHPYNGVVQVPR
jgi:hypothetical protein